MKPIRYAAGNAPIIQITKWHDLETGELFYDLYLNGKVDSRYDINDLMKRIQEVLFNV